MNPVPKWFKCVAGIALLWNLLGCVAFFSDLTVSPQDLAKLSAAQQAMHASRPAWSVAATGIAVFGGSLGCLGLLLAKPWSYPLLALSLLGVIAQDLSFFVTNGAAPQVGSTAVILQGVVLVVAISLVLLARKAQKMAA